ncbi:hypothetical protein [Magnetofaba australis]|uniref:Uncharacterized protein n=1 Tax=Magnetofaba australis IT-1 TaxID=1434232 RepID=A0A1Y2K935_9PROT|nr:hypothetical protein [Magnetofaba australis]OSM07243.1 hypothetical protein MAIT1_03824 [Magnetofaba australis IT-1]
MRKLIQLFFFLSIPYLAMGGVAQAKTSSKIYYESGAYSVRQVKVDGRWMCKLEISLRQKGTETAYLGIYASRAYYGEIVTDKNRVGFAKKALSIRFDKERSRSVKIISDAPGSDGAWLWRYVDLPADILTKISKSRTMRVSLHNGKRTINYALSLKGSAKAVRNLRRCAR